MPSAKNLEKMGTSNGSRFNTESGPAEKYGAPSTAVRQLNSSGFGNRPPSVSYGIPQDGKAAGIDLDAFLKETPRNESARKEEPTQHSRVDDA